jgi:hypothetical protein
MVHVVSGGNDIVAQLDGAVAEVGAAQLRMLEAVRRVAISGAWRGDGARDLAHWLTIRYGISWWKTRKMVAASHALVRLPLVSEALSSGRLSLDKTIELCRFARPETEKTLVPWAVTVSVARVRQKADLSERQSAARLEQAEEERRLDWYWADDGMRLRMEGEFPAAQGTVIAKAIERMASRVPAMPGEEGLEGACARRADALWAICSAKLSADPDPERAHILIHASPEAVSAVARREAMTSKARRPGSAVAEFEDGTPVHPAVLSRLLCTAKVQAVIEDESGNAVSMGRTSRRPSLAMMRQLRYRDRGCRFPGCGSRAFLKAHHVIYWADGGETSLANLVLVCTFHHRLAHERGWGLAFEGGELVWRRPGGAIYRAGPSPGGLALPPEGDASDGGRAPTPAG